MTAPRPRLVGLPTRVRLVEQIGRGGTATVWRARDTHHGLDVAVKIIESDAAGARLEREARSLARLRDLPGVLTVREMGMTPDGIGWIVTQLASGGSLRDRIEATPLGPGECASVGASLAATLAGAHDREVVHGDLTPANVLFDDSGAPLVSDFGSADLGDVIPDAVSTTTGFTPAYAAPERLRGAVVLPSGDVYSLAATLAACGVADPALQACLDLALDSRPSRRPSAARMADDLAAVARTLDDGSRRGSGGRRRRRR